MALLKVRAIRSLAYVDITPRKCLSERCFEWESCGLNQHCTACSKMQRGEPCEKQSIRSMVT